MSASSASKSDICFLCEKPKNHLRFIKGLAAYVCGNCAKKHVYKRVEKKCEHCGEFKHVRKNRKLKIEICEPCRRTLTYTFPCSFCGKENRVALRRDGQVICTSCYKAAQYDQPSYPCERCGKVAPYKKRTGENSGICTTCYDREWRLLNE